MARALTKGRYTATLTAVDLSQSFNAAEQLMDSGELGAARRAYAALTKLSRRKNGQTVVTALLGVARCDWYMLQTQHAVETTKEASKVALRYAPAERPRVLFALADLYDALGQGDEAQGCLGEAETGQGHISLEELPIWLLTHGLSETTSNSGNRAQLYFNLAYDFAERRKDYRAMRRVLGNVAFEAPACGLAHKQLEFQRRAFELASAHLKNWTVHLEAVDLARTLIQTGDLPRAQGIIYSLMGNDEIRRIPTVDVRLTAVGLDVAVLRKDEALIQALSTRPTNRWLVTVEEPQLLGPLVGAAHALQLFQGNKLEAKKILETGVRALRNADAAWPALIAASEYGTESIAARARRLLTAMPSSNLVAQAHLQLFDALILRRRNSLDEATSKAGEAATSFGLLGWPLRIAKTLEIQGQLKEALRIYKRCGATYYVDLLMKSRKSRGRPRRSSIDITNRQRTLISLVLQGLTNRQIASDLRLSTSTIDHQLGEMYRRFSVKNRIQLICKIHDGVIAI